MSIERIYNWALDFIGSIYEILDWLFTNIHIEIFEYELDLAPIYLVVGVTATIGLIRRFL